MRTERRGDLADLLGGRVGRNRRQRRETGDQHWIHFRSLLVFEDLLDGLLQLLLVRILRLLGREQRVLRLLDAQPQQLGRAQRRLVGRVHRGELRVRAPKTRLNKNSAKNNAG